MTSPLPSELGQRHPRDRDDFEIAIVCALALEFDAVSLIFDEFFDTTGDVYGKARGDQNHYTTGRIGRHNVVLVLLPRMGKAAAAGVTAHLGHSYGNLKLAILAGVCGGVPQPGGGRVEIRLGDVVISKQVVQFDLGRQYPGEFVTRNSTCDSLGRPNIEISALLAFMQTEHGLGRLRMGSDEYLAQIQSNAREAGRQTTYQFPGIDKDYLFPPDYIHTHRDGRHCDCHIKSSPCQQAAMASCHELGCNIGDSVSRCLAPEHHKIQVSVGNMGSGDVVMKSGSDRDRIAHAHHLIAFEMEGAGMWDHVPCVVVKGVSDYADSHKNKEWQPYAAATAAAVSKALLVQYIRADHTSNTNGQPSGIPVLPSSHSSSLPQYTPPAKPTTPGIQDDYVGAILRLRNLPLGVDKATAAKFAAGMFNNPNISPEDVTVHTLATTTELWGEARRGVATLSIATRAIFTNKSTAPDGSYDWTAQPAGSSNRLLIDTHFKGLTVLNDVPPVEHRFDCIVLPGLARHPLLSWHGGQGGDAFNWVRDALPLFLPGVRVFLYGFGSELTNASFVDATVASTEALMSILEEDGFSAPTTKPMLFIAHSLGGLVLKRLFVALAGGNERASFMLSMVHAAIFFGTPSTAWPVSNILAANCDHRELAIYKDLTDLNEYCKNLEAQFSGVSYLENIKMFAYCDAPASQSALALQRQLNGAGFFETTIGQGSSKNPLVRPTPIPIAMDKSHWDMVKFTAGDHNLSRVVRQIAEICMSDHGVSSGDEHLVEIDINSIDKAGANTQPISTKEPASLAEEVTDRLPWHEKWMYRSIEPAQRNQRANQIEQHFGHTFDWAFEEDHAIGLATWLRSGSGTYWISGKPGSGKSTFMRFLLEDKRTSELLHDWQKRPREIVASFFFHHRGTHMQKSFEGLLRELLVQLLDAEPQLYHVLRPIFRDRLQAELIANRIGSFSTDLSDFLSICGVENPSQDLREELTRVVFQDPITALDGVLDETFPNETSYDMTNVRQAILNRYNAIASASGDVGRLYMLANQTWRSMSVPKPSLLLLHEVLATWAGKINRYGAIMQSLEDYRIFEPHVLGNIVQMAQGSRSKQSRLEASMKTLVDRQQVRQSLRLKVQLEKWTKDMLEDGVRRILEQDSFELRICTIFDALDEYDGRPETIAEFLNYLTKPRLETSKTQARVLFSSRPWPVFQREFFKCPGFQIHEHTQNDIRAFAAGALHIDSFGQRQLILLTEDVVSRARGVFLWVKLVLRDLNSRADAASMSGEDLMTSLKGCLDSLPDELEDYYATIVQRLPSSTRKETYILLECLSRTTEQLYLEDLQVMRTSGLSSSLAPRSLEKSFEYDLPDMYLRKITGGLIQSVYSDMPKRGPRRKFLQLIHQTCKEWIKTTAFKHIVLNSEANTTIENGHSYLSKINIWNMMYSSSRPNSLYQPQIYFHLEYAEKTTGVSQYEFVSSLPWEFYHSLFRSLSSSSGMSALSLAVHGRFWLLLRDCLLQGSSCTTGSEPLFTLLLARTDMQHRISDSALLSRPANDTEILECGKLLIENGYDLGQDLKGVSALLMRMWESPDCATALKYVDLVIMGLGHSLPIDTEIPIPGGLRTTKLLHLSPPRLAKWIVGRQPSQLHDVNSNGQTVLDHLVDPASVHSVHSFGPEWQFELYQLFAAKGCKFRTTSKQQVAHFLDGCARSGLEREVAADQPNGDAEVVASASMFCEDFKRLEGKEKTKPSKRDRFWIRFKKPSKR
ncbi:adenosylhomocysteine nucleosidase [Microdochium nivale]|nr:adenosylhomocysteine nucleosidase [Microdochium nivale]